MASSGIEWLRRRVLFTLLPAFVGALAGAFYAKYTLPEDVLKSSALGGMYAAAGAATMILALRITTMLRAIWKDVRPPKGDEPGEGD